MRQKRRSRMPSITARAMLKHEPSIAVCGPGRSVRRQHRNGHRTQHVTRGAAQYPLAPARMAERAHDDQVRSLVSHGCPWAWPGPAPEEHVLGLYTVGDRMRAWGASGGFWGAVRGLLLGSAVFVMPPIGIVVAAGPITLMLVTALESAVVAGGVSALCAALVELGMPRVGGRVGQGDRFAHACRGRTGAERRPRACGCAKPAR